MTISSRLQQVADVKIQSESITVPAQRLNFLAISSNTLFKPGYHRTSLTSPSSRTTKMTVSFRVFPSGEDFISPISYVHVGTYFENFPGNQSEIDQNFEMPI